MKAAIFYATREGQGKRVSDHIAESLRARRFDVDVHNVKDSPELIDMQPYQLAFLVASVHLGHHEREIVRFVKSHRAELVRLGAPFLSLTYRKPAPGLQRRRKSGWRRPPRAADDRGLRAGNGMAAGVVLPVAGALTAASRFFIKLIMKNVARRAGGPTDTTRDYEFTWTGPRSIAFMLDRVGVTQMH